MTMPIRRIITGATLLAASVLIAVGTAAASSADPHRNNNGFIYAPDPHPVFPIQTNSPEPGTQVHHDHQNNKWG